MTITQAIFAAFTQCRTKSHLIHSGAVAENPLGQARQHWDQLYQRNGQSKLRAGVLDGQLYVGTPAIEAIQQRLEHYQEIMELKATTDGLGKPFSG